MVRILLILLASQTLQVPSGDIDAFMEKVLAQRDVNWEQYYQYFGREREELTIEATLPGVPPHRFPKGIPLVRPRRLPRPKPRLR